MRKALSGAAPTAFRKDVRGCVAPRTRRAMLGAPYTLPTSYPFQARHLGITADHGVLLVLELLSF